MRIIHILSSVALILTVNQQMLSAAPLRQIEPLSSRRSSQTAPHASGGDMRQSAWDPRGYDSGLWRSVCIANPAKGNQTADRDSIAPSGEILAATPQTETARHRSDKTSEAIVYSQNLAMVPIEIPVIAGQLELEATREPDERDATTLSDWEYAVVKSGGKSRVGSTVSGPSVTSAIVGFVGIIIVIGAYASSGKRAP